jgi:type 1 glutamine amidotransferase
LLAACGGASLPGDATEDDRVLLFTRTLGYRHADSIAVAGPALAARLDAYRIAVDATEDPTVFTAENLARYRGVVFAYTTGNDVIDPTGKAAFEAFARGGGGFLGIHSVTDTEYAWPFFQELIVVPFASHPAIQPGTIHVEAAAHPAMAGVPAVWPATDEWYNFTANPRDVAGVQILATIDEGSYQGGTMGPDHPMIWCHERFGGRVLYTQLVHVAARWQEQAYLDHVVASVRWVINRD